MFLLTSTLIFISAVVYECHAEQKLVCPYGSKNKDLPKVWCKREANNESCCTGFTLTENKEYLSVESNSTAFTVTVRSLPQGDGVYWCGLRSSSNIIIKLAEKNLHNPMDLVWSILRWLLFVLLLLSVVSTHICCRKKKAKE